MVVKLDKLFDENIVLDLKILTYIPNIKKDLDIWTASLVELELGEAAKQIFITLLELRRLDCHDFVRFQIIQQIEPNLSHLLLSLEQHYLSNSLLDTKRDQQISELVLEIKSNHALLYIELFKRTQATLETYNFSFFEFNLKKKLNVFRKQTAILAIHRLMHLLYSLQLLYLDVPKNFWTSAYRIYQIACEYHFNLDKVEKIAEQHSNIDSTEKAFAQLILLFLLNSHKLRQSEIKELMQCISYWTSLIHFSENQGNQSHYYLDIQSDIGPKLNLQNNVQHQNFHYINTTELASYIEATLRPNAHYYSKIEEKSLTHVLKRHIVTTLNLNPTRIRPRYEDHGTLEVTLGITSAHFFLSHAKHFKETLDLDIDLSLQSNNQVLSQISGDKEIQLSSRTHEQRFNAEITKIYHADIINRSENGYGLQWHSQVIKNLRTGEFILIKEHQGTVWTGALIRWMKHSQQQSLEFGIEIITKSMCSLAVSIPKQNTALPIYHPAILYKNDGQDYAIILPSAQVFYENQNLSLRLGQNEFKIFLKHSSVLTQSCAIFSFDLLERSKQPMMDRYFQHHITTLQTQDLWESLK
ncbi:hypothetical protein [Acinetobacter puyangensis]|uniref:hypothetical protein n=1 Tax=Acinetobacter puyangensis TaxID=1096779 RepID=UPI003A4DE2F3